MDGIRAWFKKNERYIVRIGVIGAILNIPSLLPLEEMSIVPSVIIVWLFYTIYANDGWKGLSNNGNH